MPVPGDPERGPDPRPETLRAARRRGSPGGGPRGGPGSPPPSRAPEPGSWSRLDRALGALALLAAVFLAGRGAVKAIGPRGSDFTIFHEGARAVLRGSDARLDAWNLYPPSFPVLTAPIGLLPHDVAAVAWQLASLALLFWSARRAAELASGGSARLRPILVWLPLLLLLRPVDSNFSYGQVNAFTLAICLASISALAAGRERAAGAWAALGAALKIVPGFLLVWFLLRRSWRAALWGGGALALLLVVPPLLALGPARGGDALADWWSETAFPYSGGRSALLERFGYQPGQSLLAAGYRTLAPVPATSRGAEGGTANLVDLEPGAARWIVAAALAAHLAAFAAAVLVRRAPRGGRSFAAEAAFALATALVLSPITRKAHLVWLLPAYAVLAAGAAPGAGRLARAAPIALGALSVALIGLTAPAVVGRSAATALLAHNAVFLGLACAWLALFAGRLADRPSAVDAPPGR